MLLTIRVISSVSTGICRGLVPQITLPSLPYTSSPIQCRAVILIFSGAVSASDSVLELVNKGAGFEVSVRKSHGDFWYRWKGNGKVYWEDLIGLCRLMTRP